MTLKCIAGIETPDSGFISLNGRVLYDSSKKINLPPQKRNVGYLFQEYALFPTMTAAENISIVMKAKESGPGAEGWKNTVLEIMRTVILIIFPADRNSDLL